jgi:hypothetical protein
MLRFPQKKNRWLGKAQSGFYIDFILKKLSEVFIRNVFVYAALFFGEKYMIEHLTKKVVDSFIYNSNKFVGWTTLNYMWFFYITLSIVLYMLLLLNLILLFL